MGAVMDGVVLTVVAGAEFALIEPAAVNVVHVVAVDVTGVSLVIVDF